MNNYAGTRSRGLPAVVDGVDGPWGINVCGFLRDESGWGTAARKYIRALNVLGVPLALNDISAISSNRSDDRSLSGFGSDHPYPVNLICVDPTQHYAVLSHLGAEYLQGRYNIGAWAWELPRFPAKWVDRLAFYDEIWVMSSFVANALAPLAPIPVVRIPPPLSMHGTRLAAGEGKASRREARRSLGLSERDFVFLFVFDFHSHLARKNPLAVIESFKLAFGPAEPVRLVLKCVNGEADPGGLSLLNERARGSRILIYDGYWPDEALQDLFAGCDAYVSLHRAEGLGLTIAEAMAFGKPVIATGWSGNMDFMNVSNSFPVRYRLVEIQENVGPYQSGELWAEPSVEHAAQLMRHVFEQRREAMALAEAGRKEIEEHYSEAGVAALIRERLEAVRLRRDLHSFRDKSWAAFLDYRELAARIRGIVRETLPPGATVLVVGKGDEELVKLEERKGWHFPQTENGAPLGYHPANSRAAIEHLEELSAKGAEYLLFPNVAFWWLDYYSDFRKHLDTRRSRIWNDEYCIIYRLES